MVTWSVFTRGLVELWRAAALLPEKAVVEGVLANPLAKKPRLRANPKLTANITPKAVINRNSGRQAV